MREENGKIIPEVGDVWFNKYTRDKYHVIKIDSLADTVDYIRYCDLTLYFRRKCEFEHDFIYIGKSKVSVKDLFEVE